MPAEEGNRQPIELRTLAEPARQVAEGAAFGSLRALLLRPAGANDRGARPDLLGRFRGAGPSATAEARLRAARRPEAEDFEPPAADGEPRAAEPLGDRAVGKSARDQGADRCELAGSDPGTPAQRFGFRRYQERVASNVRGKTSATRSLVAVVAASSARTFGAAGPHRTLTGRRSGPTRRKAPR